MRTDTHLDQAETKWPIPLPGTSVFQGRTFERIVFCLRFAQRHPGHSSSTRTSWPIVRLPARRARVPADLMAQEFAMWATALTRAPSQPTNARPSHRQQSRLALSRGGDRSAYRPDRFQRGPLHCALNMQAIHTAQSNAVIRARSKDPFHVPATFGVLHCILPRRSRSVSPRQFHHVEPESSVPWGSRVSPMGDSGAGCADRAIQYQRELCPSGNSSPRGR